MSEFDYDLEDVGEDDIEFLDTSDNSEESIDEIDMDAIEDDVDDGYYHATKMSGEEVERIDDVWSEDDTADDVVEPYHATKNDIYEESDIREPYRATRNLDEINLESDIADEASDIEQSIEAFEEQFAYDTEAMSLVNSLEHDVSDGYDNGQPSYDRETFDTLTKDLSYEQLSQLRDGLANRESFALDYFGLNTDDSDDDDRPVRARRR